MKPIEGKHVDEGDEDGNILQGHGKPYDRWHKRDKVRAMTALKHVIRDMTPEGWDEDTANEADMVMYSYADLHTNEPVYSRKYTQAKSRVSWFVECRYQEGGEDEEETKYIAEVHFFVLARRSVAADVLRFAVADIYKLSIVDCSAGQAWKAGRSSDIRNYGVRLMDMTYKMVWSKCDSPGHVYFLEYGNVSGSGRLNSDGQWGVVDREDAF
jgi:hypothetical protein